MICSLPRYEHDNQIAKEVGGCCLPYRTRYVDNKLCVFLLFTPVLPFYSVPLNFSVPSVKSVESVAILSFYFVLFTSYFALLPFSLLSVAQESALISVIRG